jgi:hypothetical protein
MRKRTVSLFALIPLVVGLLVIGGFPGARGEGFPPTVSAQIQLPADDLEGAGLARTPGGGLEAAAAARTSEPRVCSPFWFTGVAVTWNQSNRKQAWADVRVSEDGETFAEPDRLPSNPDDTPDRGSPEWDPRLQGTPLLWTGGSRCVRVSLEVPSGTTISDVEIMFLNSSGTVAGPGTAPATSASASAFAPDQAQAATKDPTIVGRDQWGAVDPRCGPYYADEVKMAFVHHTDGLNRYASSASDDILRGIQRYHMVGRHWCDIAYNFLIDRYGTLFEGRAGGVDQPVISGATQGVNTGSVSVALIGSYQHTSPTAPELTTLKRFLAWRLDVAHVNPAIKTSMTSAGGDNTWVDPGQTVRLHTISGHRDTGYTDCPGSRVYRKLPAIRRAVSRMGLPKIYSPQAWPFAPGTLPWTVVAKGSTNMDWEVDIAPRDGDTIRTLTFSGDRLKVKWDGLDAVGAQAPPGPYLATIKAHTADGNARPATVLLRIKTEPSPSPSPSVVPTVAPATR